MVNTFSTNYVYVILYLSFKYNSKYNIYFVIIINIGVKWVKVTLLI
jgi:hypothetical protein